MLYIYEPKNINKLQDTIMHICYIALKLAGCKVTDVYKDSSNE